MMFVWLLLALILGVAIGLCIAEKLSPPPMLTYPTQLSPVAAEHTLQCLEQAAIGLAQLRKSGFVCDVPVSHRQAMFQVDKARTKRVLEVLAGRLSL